MSAKHKPFKIRAGHYNYRGYCPVKRGARWVLFYEDDSISASARTLRGITKIIDKWIKLEATP